MSSKTKLTPDTFVIEQVFNEGFKTLKALGFVNAGVLCLFVTDGLCRKYWVPVIVAKRPENIDKRDIPLTFMFFGEQAENDEGGVACYALLETRITNGLPVEIPEQEAKYLHWTRETPA